MSIACVSFLAIQITDDFDICFGLLFVSTVCLPICFNLTYFYISANHATCACPQLSFVLAGFMES
jgi:hypothetical protein